MTTLAKTQKHTIGQLFLKRALLTGLIDTVIEEQTGNRGHPTKSGSD
jgi:hypothetical protein